MHHRKISSCIYFKPVLQPSTGRMDLYGPKAEGPRQHSRIPAVPGDSLAENPFFFKPEWLEFTLKYSHSVSIPTKYRLITVIGSL